MGQFPDKCLYTVKCTGEFISTQNNVLVLFQINTNKDHIVFRPRLPYPFSTGLHFGTRCFSLFRKLLFSLFK